MNKSQSTALCGFVVLVALGVFAVRVAVLVLGSAGRTVDAAILELAFSPMAWVTIATTTASITGGAFWVFNKYLWPLAPTFISPRPDLRGTWKSRVTPILMKDGKVLPEPGRPFAAYMVVRQTFLRLQMELLTDRTRSMLMGEHLAWNEESDSYTVWAVYECKPVGIQDEGNLYHLGAFKLGPGRRDAAKWDGTYFMDAELLIDRDKRIVTRQGAIHLIERRHKEYDSYAHAEKAFTRLRRRMPGAVLSLDPPVVTGQQV